MKFQMCFRHSSGKFYYAKWYGMNTFEEIRKLLSKTWRKHSVRKFKAFFGSSREASRRLSAKNLTKLMKTSECFPPRGWRASLNDNKWDLFLRTFKCPDSQIKLPFARYIHVIYLRSPFRTRRYSKLNNNAVTGACRENLRCNWREKGEKLTSSIFSIHGRW